MLLSRYFVGDQTSVINQGCAEPTRVKEGMTIMKNRKKVKYLVLAFCLIFGLYSVNQFLSSVYAIREDMKEVRDIMDPFEKKFCELQAEMKGADVSEIDQLEKDLNEEIERWNKVDREVERRLKEIDRKAKIISYINPWNNDRYGVLRGEIGTLWGQYGVIRGSIGYLTVVMKQ